ncbi:exodeoxyribonuclease VII large subunit [Nitratireductor basaltis]|uniref:Exodeoxyribonuclease 7 large subunit n=1 Tax=Nitratireductor basaltis TaxID=472175 RepID=A0A084UDR1_9HYPH|nr:exodeoxyribonuclease VII large subunit [Nitratireductor basaltis]KFB11097.1 Exodeoxyribonuclease 7 large subunit [Nitratireductor basaltis]
MSSLTPSDTRSNVAEYSVSEVSIALKRTVEEQFGHVRVRGEVSGYRGPHASGHCYFALKDERSRLEAVVWKGVFGKLKFKPQEGLEIVATGKLTTYPGSSKYQIVIESIEPAGAGALMALLEERKRKLAAEGLFADERKQLLPFMPKVIGVVTSPTGAVIRDIIHRIADRFPVHVVVWPVRVQGETTGAEVSAAVEGFNRADIASGFPRPDVIIVARGGGSLEDLWGFNDEEVVRAVAASDIPVISAVGHETDWTLIDLAADRRAPTPTGAAEMAVPVKAELEAGLARLSARLKAAITRDLDRRKQASRALARALPSPDQLFALSRRRFDEAAGRLERGLSASTRAKRLRHNSLRLSLSMLDRRLTEARRRNGEFANRLASAFQNSLRAKRTRRSAVRLSLAPLNQRISDARRRHVDCSNRLPALFLKDLNTKRTRLERDAARVTPRQPLLRLQNAGERLERATERLDRAMGQRLELARNRSQQVMRLADTLSYKSVLERGFALVRDGEGVPVKRAAQLKPGQEIAIEFADGRAGAVATGGSAPAPQKKAAPKPPAGRQGSLF